MTTNGSKTTTGIVVTFSRPTDFTREGEWARWYDEQHLPDTVGGDAGAWVATRFETVDRPPLFSAPVGFTHMTIHELADVDRDGPRFLDHLRGLRDSGRLHPLHAIIGLDVLRAEGRYSVKPEPDDALKGHVFAYTMSNQRSAEAEWGEWYDTVHVPDMEESGAFTGTTRWVRTQRTEFGPDFLTLYDVGIDDVGEAVVQSGSVMPGIIERGRLHERHAGGLRNAVRAVGAHAGAGCRADGF